MNNLRRMESRASSIGKREEAEILLPDIKMRPRKCDHPSAAVSMRPGCTSSLHHTHGKLGAGRLSSGHNPGTIALDAPCGAKRDHIAALINPSYGRPAAICLCWEILRKQKQFPCDALDAYQTRVRRIAPLHVTPSSAHISHGKVIFAGASQAIVQGDEDSCRLYPSRNWRNRRRPSNR